MRTHVWHCMQQVGASLWSGAPRGGTARDRGRASALLLALLLLSALLVGCDGDSGGSGGPGVAPDDQQIFTILLTGPNNGDFAKLDPALIEYTDDQRVAQLIYMGLVTLDDNARVIPDGAESWTVSPDGKTYTFKIRANIKWSDGTPITARDFAAALGRSLDPCVDSGTSLAK